MNRLLTAAAVGVGLLGCSRSPPPSKFPSADAALARMRESQSCSRGVAGDAKLDYFGDRGRVRGSLMYLAMVPDRVRLDVVSPFGATLSSVTSDGQNFALFDLKAKSLLRGPANACNLQRFTRVPLPPHAFTELLRGEAPVLVHEPSAATLQWDGSAYAIKIQSRNLAEEQIQLVPAEADWNQPWQAQRVRVLRVSVQQAGVPLYQVMLDEHAPGSMSTPRLDPDGIDPPIPPSGPECHAELPHRLRFMVGDGESDLVVANREVSHNPPLAPGVFEQPAPPGVSVRYSPCSD